MATLTIDSETESPTDIVASEYHTVGQTEFTFHRHRRGTTSFSVIRSGFGGNVYSNSSIQMEPGVARAIALALLRIDPATESPLTVDAPEHAFGCECETCAMLDAKGA